MCPWQHRWIWTIPTCQTFARQWYPDGLARPSPRLPRPGAATRERTREGLCCSQSGDCALVYGSSNLSLPCCGSRGGMLWNACTNEAPFRLSRQCIEGPLPFLYFFPFFFAAAAFSSDSCIFAMAKPMLLSPPVIKSPARRRQHQDANGECGNGPRQQKIADISDACAGPTRIGKKAGAPSETFMDSAFLIQSARVGGPAFFGAPPRKRMGAPTDAPSTVAAASTANAARACEQMPIHSDTRRRRSLPEQSCV